MGISACLLGEPVRYDGGHKAEPVAIEALAKRFVWVPLCPEVELGLGVPREPIRVEEEGRRLRLRAVETRRDLTDAMAAWSRSKVRELATHDLCGLVLKSLSPSCGLGSTPVHRTDGHVLRAGDGFFAAVARRAWPELPVLDEEGLRDARRREAFLRDVDARWKALRNARGRP